MDDERLNLYKFYWNCDRSGELRGLFVATELQISMAIGRPVHFGEVLGKYSDISGTFDYTDITKIEVSQSAIDEVTDQLGYTWSGYNPFDYMGQDEE